MLAEISEKVLSHLNDCGLDVADIEFKHLVDRQTGGLMRPKVNVSIDSGVHQKVAMNKYKQIPVVSLYILVQNLKGEKEARFAAYKLLDGIVQSLLLEKIGLPLQDSFKPVAFNNVTDEEFAGAGFSLYHIDFTCSFNYFKENADLKDSGELLKIVNTYYIDSDSEFSGEVELSEADAGNAFSDSVEDISGGKAGTNNYIEDIDGGDSKTTYGN